jgi:hypothetical protein
MGSGLHEESGFGFGLDLFAGDAGGKFAKLETGGRYVEDAKVSDDAADYARAREGK